jgi:GGDEF domain-containing protein
MRIVKETIANTLRGTDVVVQRDHDFLLVLLRDCDEDGLDRTGKRVERLANTLGIEWWGDWISAGIAIGAAAPQPGDTEQTLLSRAEAALTNNIAVSELTPQKQA